MHTRVALRQLLEEEARAGRSVAEQGGSLWPVAVPWVLQRARAGATASARAWARGLTKPCARKRPAHDSGRESCAGELAHVARHRDEPVHCVVLVHEHVLIRCVVALLERVGRAPEERAPHPALHKGYARRARCGSQSAPSVARCGRRERALDTAGTHERRWDKDCRR